jgi:hypothetical protein
MLGMRVMAEYLLGSNEEAVAARNACVVGKRIAGAEIRDEDDGSLLLKFEDGISLFVEDHGRSCCETRYMDTDDDLRELVGEVFRGIEVADGPETLTSGEPHETAFLRVKTDKSTVTVVTHNEHNGYYGGFLIRCRLVEAEGEAAGDVD